MTEQHWLAERFEADRLHLRAVAYRLLGSQADADDAIQDAWPRVNRANTSDITNLTGWFTTIVARICLNVLQSRRSHREVPLEERATDFVDRNNPEHDTELTDSVGAALLVALDTLGPAELLAFVLHDVFAVPFDEIAQVVRRSPSAARQLASRARRRLQGTSDIPRDRSRQRAVAEAFLTASREGDFEALLAVLDPDVVLRADTSSVQAALARQAHGAPTLAREIRTAAAVARVFSGRAQAAQPALIDGRVGAVWAPGGQLRAVFDLTQRGGNIIMIEMLSDPAAIHDLAITLL